MYLDHDYLKYRKIQDEDVILDIGATGGEFAKDFLEDILRTNSQYIAVEPEEYNRKVLKDFLDKNLPLNSSIVDCAISPVDGIINLKISSSYLYHSVYEHALASNFYKEIPVKSMRLDTLIKYLNRDISILKCDIEGEELEIFSDRSFDLYDKLSYISIAAYHDISVGGDKTYTILKPLFESKGFKTIVEVGDEAKGFIPLELLYAWR